MKEMTRVETDTVMQADPILSELLEQLRATRAVEAAAKAEADLLKERIIKEYEAAGTNEATFTDSNGRRFVATVRADAMPEKVDLDQVLNLNPDLYRKITKIELDRTAFKRAKDRGEFDAPYMRSTITKTYKSPSVYFADAPTGGVDGA